MPYIADFNRQTKQMFFFVVLLQKKKGGALRHPKIKL